MQRIGVSPLVSMTFDECTAAIRAKVGSDSGLNATLKFDCGDADCTVGITLDHLAAMLRGELEPAAGFMTGKPKAQGDLSVALRMQRLV